MIPPSRRDPVDEFLEGLGTAAPPADLAGSVMTLIRAHRRGTGSRWWLVAAAAAIVVALGAGAVWIGTQPDEPDPTSTPEPSLERMLFLRTFDGTFCPLAGLPRGPITFRIDPDAAEPDQVLAIDVAGRPSPVLWAEGFTGGPVSDPVVRDPAGEIVARDGEQFRLTPDDDRLHGYRVCAGSGNLYVLLVGREDPAATPSLRPATDLGLLPGAWTPIAAAPVPGRTGHTAVWTGTEMIIWGGEPGPATPDEQLLLPGGDGAAYSPATDTWRAVSPAPLEARTLHSAAWTGSEMIIWGGVSLLAGAPLGDGAAYDPESDRWRPLPAPPFEPSGAQAIVWVHDELVVLDGEVVTDRPFHLEVAAYRPATNDWATLPDLESPGVDAYSVATTGSSLEVVVLLAGPNGSAAYSLRRPPDAWRRLADPPSLRVGAPGPEIFTGTEILVPATVGGIDVVAAFDAARETWRVATPPLGLGGGGNTWTGTLAFFGLGTGGLERRTVYDPTRDAWFGVLEAPGIHREAATHVWAGDRLLVWGGFEGESFLRPIDGVTFVPAARFADAGNPDLAGPRVEIVDASASLVTARTPALGEIMSADRSPTDEPVLIANLDDRTLFVEWIGGPGDAAARIEIGADPLGIDLVAVPTYGDAMAVGWSIVLEFDRAIDADEVDLRFWDGRR